MLLARGHFNKASSVQRMHSEISGHMPDHVNGIFLVILCRGGGGGACVCACIYEQVSVHSFFGGVTDWKRIHSI